MFVETLVRFDVREIFTLVGDHLNGVLPVAAAAGIRLIDLRHESGVTHAAEAWARTHRRPAVTLVTGGPGHTNSLTGIAAAHLACTPLIAVSGARPRKLAGKGAFQEVDHCRMAAPVTKWSAEPESAAAIPAYLEKAWRIASDGRMGPVHLNIPVDLFAEAAEAVAMPERPAGVRRGPDPEAVRAALRMLEAAERPVAIAGSGVWWSDAGAELQALIERLQLPLFTIGFARGVVSDTHPLCFGYGDPSLNRASLAAFQEADLLFVVGKRIDYRLAFGGPRMFGPEAKLVQIDIHGPELGLNRRPEVGIEGDAKAALGAMLGEVRQRREGAWIQKLRAARSEWSEMLSGVNVEGEGLHPAAFYAELRKHLPAGTLFSWDGGDFVHWGRAVLPAVEAGGWLRLGPLAAIGSSLPNALALKMARPEQPVVMITGDGSLGFYIAEIDSLVRHGLPIIMIVGNDGGWGLERELQRAAGQTVIACELRRTRYDLITRGFGAGGETIDRVEQVGPAMQRALESGVPYCLNVNIRGARSPFTEWQIAGKRG